MNVVILELHWLWLPDLVIFVWFINCKFSKILRKYLINWLNEVPLRALGSKCVQFQYSVLVNVCIIKACVYISLDVVSAYKWLVCYLLLESSRQLERQHKDGKVQLYIWREIMFCGIL